MRDLLISVVVVVNLLSFVPFCARMLRTGSAAGVSRAMLLVGVAQGALLAAFNLTQGKLGCAAAFTTVVAGFGAAWVIAEGRRVSSLLAPASIATAALLLAAAAPRAAAVLGLLCGAVRVLPQVSRSLSTRNVANLSPWLFAANLFAATLIVGLELTAADTRLVNVASFSMVITANALQLAVMAFVASHARASASVVACSGTASR